MLRSKSFTVRWTIFSLKKGTYVHVAVHTPLNIKGDVLLRLLIYNKETWVQPLSKNGKDLFLLVKLLLTLPSDQVSKKRNEKKS